MAKPYNWRTDYDWTDPDDAPVGGFDETVIDETEFMLPKDAGIKSLREGRNMEVATSGPSHRIGELIRRYNDGTITEEEKIELEMLMEMTPMMAHGGRMGYANQGMVTADTAGVSSKIPPSRRRQIEGSQELDRAYNEIAQTFHDMFPGIEEELSINDMIAMLQAEGVMDQNLEILGLDRSMRMITPESVDRSVQRMSRGDTQYGDIPPEMFKAHGGRIGYAFGDPEPGVVEDDLSTIEFMQDQGIPYGEQASGIDPNIRIEEIVQEFIKRKGRRPRSIEEIKEFYMQEMAGGQGGSQRFAYRPGDYDPMIVDEYEKYKGSQEEQGLPVISIDEFLQQQRMGAQSGGLPGLLGV